MAASYSAFVLLLLVSSCCCFNVNAAEPKGDAAASAGDSDDDVVARLCASVTSDFCHMHLTKKYCVSTLQLDTRSARARDARDLALVAMDLARGGAAAADAKVAGVLLERKSISEEAARTLRYCRTDYAAVARLAPLCRDMIEEYRPGGGAMRKYHALGCANKMIRAAKNCGHVSLFEEEFGEALQKEFIDVARRTALVKAMVEETIDMKDAEGFDSEFDNIVPI